MHITTAEQFKFWCQKKGEDRATALSSAGAHLWSQYDTRRRAHEHYARLYGDIPMMGLSPWAWGTMVPTFEGPTVSLNLVRSITDTWVSLASQVGIRPIFLTTKGAWHDRKRAQGFQKLTDAAFYLSGFRDLEPILLRDAAIFGSYHCKWYAVKNAKGKWQPMCERVMPDEVLYDRVDAASGRPTFCVQRKLIDRGRLAAMFPKHKNEILKEMNNAYDRDTMSGPDATVIADLIEVWEGWHLKSGPDAKDGVHCIAVEGIDLTDYEHGDDEWDDEFFPFTVYHYGLPQGGVHGTGIACNLTAIQFEVNSLLIDIRESQHTVAIPRLALSNGSMILATEIDDTIGSIINTSGEAPTPLIWPAYSQDVYAHLKWLIEQAYAMEGYSTYDATGVKPAGLNSGAAQRAFADIVSKRHGERMKRREAANRDAAKQIVALMRRCANADPDFSLTFRGKYELENIEWKDVDLNDDAYEIQCFSASALPLEPAARIQTIQELATNEWITKAEGKALLGFPDFEQITSLDIAPMELIMDRLDRMLNEERYFSPDGITDLNAALQIGGKFYQWAELRGAEESGLRYVRKFLEDVDARIKATPTAAMAPGGGNPAAMGPPAGPPMPPPPGVPGGMPSFVPPMPPGAAPGLPPAA